MTTVLANFFWGCDGVGGWEASLPYLDTVGDWGAGWKGCFPCQERLTMVMPAPPKRTSSSW